MGLELKLRLAVTPLIRGTAASTNYIGVISDGRSETAVVCQNRCRSRGLRATRPIVLDEPIAHLEVAVRCVVLGGSMMDGAETGLGRLRERSGDVGTAESGSAREAVELAVQERLRPLQVRVSGRVGVGKSVILSVLAAAGLHTDGFEMRLHESEWADTARAIEVQPNVDVLVHVLAGGVSPDDAEFLATGPGGPPEHTVILLNKADTLDEPAATAAGASAQLGRRVLPVMGSVAAGLGGAGRGSAVEMTDVQMADVRAVAASELRIEDLMTVDRFRKADIPLSTRRREALLDCVELRGLAFLVDALRRSSGVSDADVLRRLWESTGVDAVTIAVSDALSAAATARDDDLRERLLQISARHRHVRGAIESYLASDEAVAADMRCAAVRLGARIETGSERALLEQALLWKRCVGTAEDDAVRRSALALCRGYVRMLRP